MVVFSFDAELEKLVHREMSEKKISIKFINKVRSKTRFERFALLLLDNNRLYHRRIDSPLDYRRSPMDFVHRPENENVDNNS